MLIRDVMTKDVIIVAPEASINTVGQLLIKHKIHGIPVIEAGKPIGMITETDFFTKGAVTVYLPQYIDFLKKDSIFGKSFSEGNGKIDQLLSTRAMDIMSYPCVTVCEQDDVADFFKLVQEKKMISVPVVDRAGTIAGIVTLADIINLIDLKG